MRFNSFEEMLRYWAQQSPDAPALCGEDGTWSYREFLERVLRRAEELERLVALAGENLRGADAFHEQDEFDVDELRDEQRRERYR